MQILTVYRIFIAVFILSGFSGLIYESIWTHYLKLFLGHAAYAQSLVLVIFMGGMALGSWLCSRFSHRWANLLLGYALVEAVIGVCALLFHETFDGFVHLAYTSLFPALGSPSLVMTLKWLSAALFILPQSILLGMTFPLISAGLIRVVKHHSGATIAILYFANSLGAAVGVLASGFVLIDWFGLPGTMRTAGVINILLALFVYMLLRKPPLNAMHPPAEYAPSGQNPAATNLTYWVFLGIAFSTGMASFIYEIAWIRMLSLVLGASTHAFELMLSAFILGLALGGLWIKRRIDGLRNEKAFLGYVQVTMGMLALLTLPLYGNTFEAMLWVFNNTDKTDQGYWVFNLSSHAIAMAIMLPTTFCAGITLPLITHVLLKSSVGEKAIGGVYAFNTLGAIAGVLLAVHLIMPLFGLKQLIAVGAVIDMAVGLALLWRFAQAKLWQPAVTTAVSAVALILILLTVQLDPYKMASGVYRSGHFYTPENSQVLFHQDGKTASVDLVHVKNLGEVSIITNGKPDASINMSGGRQVSPDEYTMTLLGALPLAYRPHSRNAAVIGLGSGMTSNVLLSMETIEQVDTIEIEQAIVEAAKGYRPKVELVYSSSKSTIYIEDAKTFFSTHNKQYDIIVSEPSNPWVSGIASLFTEEFYQLASRHLSNDGVFVQWLHLYEINGELVASVIKALSSVFDDYVIYAANNHDLVILSKLGAPFELPSKHIFNSRQVGALLHRIGVRKYGDLLLHKIGEKNLLSPYFASYTYAANSDYYPVLDLNATKARFLQNSALSLVDINAIPLRAFNLLGSMQSNVDVTRITPRPYFGWANRSFAAMLLRDFMLQGKVGRQFYKLPEHLRQAAFVIQSELIQCQKSAVAGNVVNFLYLFAEVTIPYLSDSEVQAIWRRIKESPCYATRFPEEKMWIDLFFSVAQGDSKLMRDSALALLPAAEQYPDAYQEYLLLSAMLGHLLNNEQQQALQLWKNSAEWVYARAKPLPMARLLLALSAQSLQESEKQPLFHLAELD